MSKRCFQALKRTTGSGIGAEVVELGEGVAGCGERGDSPVAEVRFGVDPAPPPAIKDFLDTT